MNLTREMILDLIAKGAAAIFPVAVGWICHSLASIFKKVNSIDKLRADVDSAHEKIRNLTGEKK